jgi:CheY-like chemotaxis protein
MSQAQHTLESLFDLLDRYTAELHEKLGPNNATHNLDLVRELIASLSHKYLLAASREEIKAAGRVMKAGGRDKKEMRLLQATLLELLDEAFRARILLVHPLRDPGGRPASRGTTPEAALLVGPLQEDHIEAIRTLLEPAGIVVLAEPSHVVALDRIAWFPFAYIISSLPAVAPIEFLDTVRAAGSLCRNAGLVLLVNDNQEEEASTYIGRGANRVIPISGLGMQLPLVISELGVVSERTKVSLVVEADLEEGQLSEVWQSENISVTGMLLRTSSEQIEGSEVLLHFSLPGDDLPIHVQAEVVRRTTFAREDFTGAGVRFLSFVGEGLHRLELFLRRGAA